MKELKAGHIIGGKWRLKRDLVESEILGAELFESLDGVPRLVDGDIAPEELQRWWHLVNEKLKIGLTE